MPALDAASRGSRRHADERSEKTLTPATVSQYGREMSAVSNVVRVLLGATMIGAGISHLTVARREFRAQVPSWFPVDEDTTVVVSGVIEVALGAALVAAPKHRRLVGRALAAFYVAVFPGNLAQYVERRDAFGLDTDRKRLVRLFIQPALVAAALVAGR